MYTTNTAIAKNETNRIPVAAAQCKETKETFKALGAVSISVNPINEIFALQKFQRKSLQVIYEGNDTF